MNILEQEDVTGAILDKIEQRIYEIMTAYNHDRAIKLINSASTAYPNSAKLSYLKGNIFFEMFIKGDKAEIQEVLDCYQQAIKNSNEFVYIKKYTEVLLLIYNFMSNNHKELKHSIKDIIVNNLSILETNFPELEEALFLVARSYQVIGDMLSARKNFEKIKNNQELYNSAKFYINKILKSQV